MQYFRFQGIINDPAFVEANESRQNARKIAHIISMKSSEFNEKLGKDGYYFVSTTDGEIILLGAIVDNNIDVEKTLSKFTKRLTLKITDIQIDEVTLNTISNMLACASRNDYINDEDEVLESFELDRLNGRWGRSMEYGENLMEEISKEDLLEKSQKYLSKETLRPELENIFSMNVKAGQYGHPVHYFVETDDKDLTKDFYRMILQGLRLSGRLKCKRYSFVDFNPGSEFSKQAYECLYKSSVGSAIVVRVRMNGIEENDHASAERENITTICEMMKKYRNQVLTIFCLPRECTKLKDLFYENLGNLCFIYIREDFARNEDAKDFLKMLAKDNHIRTDKALFAKVKKDEGYLSTNLHDMFDEWYDAKLRNSIFPQYKESKTVKKEYQKSAPKGNAYDELNEMIGITEAKKVIKQALDYYKAQKLFKDKGMGEDQLAMHMCFTGAPGTCKTTCARLFSEIMKDNGLLSKGHLIELTANELKGKYVGWTGPQVKKAFEQAKGGILFLDEVYSLVEDHNGSFGDEAIATIVAEMENHRDEVVCIFAGYPDKTEEFLQKNPGLRSRIAFHVPFADYTTEELCEISKLIAKNKGRKLTDEAIEKLGRLYDSAKNEPDFGNGRYCRNVIEKAKLAQSSRLVSMDYDSVSKEDIETLTAEDIQVNVEIKPEKRKIGFCA